MARIWVSRIAYSTSVDGVGLRNALYVSGCDIHCEGCHNPQIWELKSGKEMTVQEAFDMLNVDEFNISILGGEPLMQYEAIVELCKKIKEKTSKTIWLWSGHTYEEIVDKYPKVLEYIDVLVDGPFKLSLRDTSLAWRGSKNQRVISISGRDQVDSEN